MKFHTYTAPAGADTRAIHAELQSWGSLHSLSPGENPPHFETSKPQVGWDKMELKHKKVLTES